jgi:hypothetical protein
MKRSDAGKSDSSNRSGVHPAAHISRRQFLKTAGVTALGAAATVLPGHILDITSPPATPEVSVEDIEAALAVAREAPMFQDALAAVDLSSFGISAAAEAVRQSSKQDQLIGLILRHQKTVSNRTGVDLLLTVDLQDKVLSAVQVVTGWCLLSLLQVMSIAFDVREPLYEELRSGRIQYDEPPRLIRPRQEFLGTFPRADPPPPQPEDFVEVGWPVETEKSRYWYYDGCSSAAWVLVKEAWVYRCTQVAEYQSKDTAQRCVLDLKYEEQAPALDSQDE